MPTKSDRHAQFFVALWDQLQTRARAAENKSKLAGDLSYDHVKDRTSSTVGTEDDGGVLFDETIAAYRERRRRAQELLCAAIIESQRKAFRAYLQRPQWTTLGEDLGTSLQSSFSSCSSLLLLSRATLCQVNQKAYMDYSRWLAARRHP